MILVAFLFVEPSVLLEDGSVLALSLSFPFGDTGDDILSGRGETD